MKMATWLDLNFQNSNSPLMEQMIFFHDHSMLMLILITTLVGYIMASLMINKLINSYFSYSTIIEMIWTILPIFILFFIAFPSLRLLYLLDNINNPLISIKSMGYQWYWSYSYPNFNNIEFNSYMNNELENNFRLLGVDNNIIIPFNIQTRMMVTAMDVLHSWTIPSLGIKIDAVPGRLNQTNFSVNSSNIFYGQCSEICGANHSFMPITMESINLKYFIKWINNFN